MSERDPKDIISALRDDEGLSFVLHAESQRILSEIREAVENQPIKEQIILARKKMQEKDFESALKILLTVKDSNILYTETWYELAVCSMHLGNNEKALEYAKCVILLAKKGRGKEYAIRLIQDPLFQPILSDLNAFFQEKQKEK